MSRQRNFANLARARSQIVNLGVNRHDFTAQSARALTPERFIATLGERALAQRFAGRRFFPCLSLSRLFDRRQPQLNPPLLVGALALYASLLNRLEFAVRQGPLRARQDRQSRRG